MTITSCLIVPEGVVLGADSTISSNAGKGYHYFNHTQKILEFGQNSTLGLVTWGLSSFREISFRTLAAIAADELLDNPVSSVFEVAHHWSKLVWKHYNEQFKDEIINIRSLEQLEKRTKRQHDEYTKLLTNLKVGFCIAGYCLPGRRPEAFEIIVSPDQRSPSIPQAVEEMGFWGQPRLFHRLYGGFDYELRQAFMRSNYWTGTDTDLDDLVQRHLLTSPELNIRDAIDFVHFSIYSTIKAMKFSNLDQVCGGPIELATITTDRKFRWVRHKDFDSAIKEGEF